MYLQGPLDVLKEEWEADRSNESVVSHVLVIRRNDDRSSEGEQHRDPAAIEEMVQQDSM